MYIEFSEAYPRPFVVTPLKTKQSPEMFKIRITCNANQEQESISFQGITIKNVQDEGRARLREVVIFVWDSGTILILRAARNEGAGPRMGIAPSFLAAREIRIARSTYYPKEPKSMIGNQSINR